MRLLILVREWVGPLARPPAEELSFHLPRTARMPRDTGLTRFLCKVGSTLVKDGLNNVTEWPGSHPCEPPGVRGLLCREEPSSRTSPTFHSDSRQNPCASVFGPESRW